MEQTFEIRVDDVPGVLARVESIFRRQRTPIRSFFFEREEGRAAQLTVTASASGEGADLIRKQLMRLNDVHAVADPATAAAESRFTFQERTA
jgi:acetolactate synthase small subunit